MRQGVELVLGRQIEDSFLTGAGVDLEKTRLPLVNGEVKAYVGFAQVVHCKQVVGSLRQHQDIGDHVQVKLSMVVLEQEWIVTLLLTDDAASKLSARDLCRRNLVQVDEQRFILEQCLVAASVNPDAAISAVVGHERVLQGVGSLSPIDKL